MYFPTQSCENFTNVQFAKPPPINTKLQLFDITGRMVLQQPLTKNLSKIELPEVAKGMYLCNIISGNENSYSGKLVVQ